MSLDRKTARRLADRILGHARRLAPGADAIVSLSYGRSANVRFARNEITSSGDVTETVAAVTLARGQRHAASTTNQTDDASLVALVERADRLARVSPEDPEWLPPLGPQRYRVTPPQHDAATRDLPAEPRVAAAASAIAAAKQAGVTVAGFHETSGGASALATSAGLFAWHESSNIELTVTARTPCGTGSGWAGGTANRAADVDVSRVVATAVDKALRSCAPRALTPGRYTVILEPQAVAELLGFLTGSLDARRADEGRSFFSRKGGGTRVGETLFPESITLGSDAADPLTPGAPYSGDGLPRQALTFIDRGRIARLSYDRYWAHKQGVHATGAPHSLHLRGGTATPEDLLAGVKRGVLITRFWYTRWLDPKSILITGLTRDGVFLVENGAVVAPVTNFRFNESPVTMLARADLLGRETVRVPQHGLDLRVPALRTHDFHLASVSDAV